MPPAYKGRGGCAYPNCSMYGRFTYIYPQNYLNVGKQAGHTLSVWVCMYIAKKVYNFQLHCIKPSQIWLPLPKNRTNPKRKRSLSNHAFSGAMLVSGRVKLPFFALGKTFRPDFRTSRSRLEHQSQVPGRL